MVILIQKHNFIIFDRIKKYLGDGAVNYNYFKDDELLNEKVDFVSIGGDGTLLRSISVIKIQNSILGINARSWVFNHHPRIL